MSEEIAVTLPGARRPDYHKPMPKLDPWNQPSWLAAEEGRFLIQQDERGNAWFPPSPVSPFDVAAPWIWAEAQGGGTVVSWVVFHQKYFAGFGDELPYNVAMVRLDEGPLLYTNLVDLNGTSIAIGLRVRVCFRPMDGTLQLPVFAPETAA